MSKNAGRQKQRPDNENEGQIEPESVVLVDNGNGFTPQMIMDAIRLGRANRMIIEKRINMANLATDRRLRV
jgi:hypothetical protein